jgi:hypothetical protein
MESTLPETVIHILTAMHTEQEKATSNSIFCKPECAVIGDQLRGPYISRQRPISSIYIGFPQNKL